MNLDYATVFSLIPYIFHVDSYSFINYFFISDFHRLSFSNVYLSSSCFIPYNLSLSAGSFNTNLSCRLFSTKVSNLNAPEEHLKMFELMMCDPDFIDWFRGFADAEGTFGIKSKNQGKNFEFIFRIVMHIDEMPLLLFIQSKLGIGKVYPFKKV